MRCAPGFIEGSWRLFAPGIRRGGTERVGMIGRSIRFGAMAVLLAMTLAGCGVRGALDGPGAKSKTGAGGLSSATKQPGEPVEKPKHRDFVLDGLIR
jgi:predicted small lipoprotein YifL